MIKKKFSSSNFLDSKQRKHNSLLNKEVKFDTTVLNPTLSNNEHNQIDEYVKNCFYNKTFDNYEYNEITPKNEKNIYEFDLCETNKEILDLWEEIDQTLNKMSFLYLLLFLPFKSILNCF